jgi:hypothetical protein
MGRDNGEGSLNTLKPQPGQTAYYDRKFHPLPGVWAQEQMDGTGESSTFEQRTRSYHRTGKSTSLQKALADERAQHTYWEKWQGVTPGTPVYEDPRAWQNTLLPTAKTKPKKNALEKARSALKKAEHVHTPRSIKQKLKKKKETKKGA